MSSYKSGPALTELQCQQMGDFCFDPQHGLYKKDDAQEDLSGTDVEKNRDPEKKNIVGFDRDLINCDPKNYFDVFCGKAKKDIQPKNKLELWIDTSSSMREFDFSDKSGGCFRKSLVERLDKTCGFNSQVNVMMFDTSIKQAGTIDSLCTNAGLNDQKRLIDWIERSEAEKLVIITDIYEYHKEFADYVEKQNGIFKGEKNPLTMAQLLDLVGYLEKQCR